MLASDLITARKLSIGVIPTGLHPPEGGSDSALASERLSYMQARLDRRGGVTVVGFLLRRQSSGRRRAKGEERS
jgi:hypothetical protein